MDTEPVLVKTPEELKNEYTKLCINAGDLQYKIKCFEYDLAKVNEQLNQINKEYIEHEQANKG